MGSNVLTSAFLTYTPGVAYSSNGHYKFDSNGKIIGVDCSALVYEALKNAGYTVPSSTFATQDLFVGIDLTPYAQQNFSFISSTDVSKKNGNLQMGDVILFNNANGSRHVGIFYGYNSTGSPMFYGSQNSTGTAVATIDKNYWGDTDKVTIVGALRPLESTYNAANDITATLTQAVQTNIANGLAPDGSTYGELFLNGDVSGLWKKLGSDTNAVIEKIVCMVSDDGTITTGKTTYDSQGNLLSQTTHQTTPGSNLVQSQTQILQNGIGITSSDTARAPSASYVSLSADGWSATLKDGSKLPDIVAAYNQGKPAYQRITLEELRLVNGITPAMETSIPVGQSLLVPHKVAGGNLAIDYGNVHLSLHQTNGTYQYVIKEPGNVTTTYTHTFDASGGSIDRYTQTDNTGKATTRITTSDAWSTTETSHLTLLKNSATGETIAIYKTTDLLANRQAGDVVQITPQADGTRAVATYNAAAGVWLTEKFNAQNQAIERFTSSDNPLDAADPQHDGVGLWSGGLNDFTTVDFDAIDAFTGLPHYTGATTYTDSNGDGLFERIETSTCKPAATPAPTAPRPGWMMSGSWPTPRARWTRIWSPSPPTSPRCPTWPASAMSTACIRRWRGL